MCNPISWIEADGKVYIITDAEIKSERGKELIKECGNAQDIWGHGFCRKYYNLTGGTEHEINDFFAKQHEFPSEIEKLIKNFKKNFSEMMRLYVPDLSSLTFADGLVLPKEVGYLDLRSLKSAEGLVLPKEVGYLDLRSLKSAEGLVLPKEVGYLDLNSLTTADGLVLPEKVSGSLYLNSLTTAEREEVRKKYGY